MKTGLSCFCIYHQSNKPDRWVMVSHVWRRCILPKFELFQNFMVIRLPFTVISHQKCVKQHFMMIYFLAIMTQGQFLLFLPIHFHSLHTHCGLEECGYGIILEKNTYADVWLCRWFVIVKNFSARCHSAYFITLKKYLHSPTIFSSTYTKVRFRELLDQTGLFLLFLWMALALGYTKAV